MGTRNYGSAILKTLPERGQIGISALRRLIADALRDRTVTVLAALAGVTALGVNLFRLGNPSIWFDEAYSVQLSKQSLGLLLRQYVWGTEAHMGLYYVLLHMWLGVTSAVGILPSEIVVRLPSAVFAAASATVVCLLGWRFWGKTAAIVAVLLYLMNYQELVSAQWARAYALQLLMCGMSWYAFLAALAASPDTRRRWYIAYCVATVIFVYAQIFSVLVVTAQVIAFTAVAIVPGSWRPRARESLRYMGASLAGIVMFTAPLLIDALRHGSKNAFIPPATLRGAAGTAIYLLGGPLEVVASPALHTVYLWLMGAVCVAAAALSIAPRLRKGEAPHITTPAPTSTGLNATSWSSGEIPRYAGALVLVCWLMVTSFLAYLGTQPGFNHYLFYYRYLVVVVPALCLLAGAGVSMIGPGVLRFAVGAALVALAFPNLLAYYQHAEVWDMRTPVQWIERQYRPGDGIACTDGLVCSVNLEYYLELYGGPAHSDVDSPGKWIWTGSTNAPTPAEFTHYAQEHGRVFVITILGLGQDQQVRMAQHYHLVSGYDTGAVVINLYDTRSPGAAASTP